MNVLKFLTIFSFLSQINVGLISGLKLTKNVCQKKQTGKQSVMGEPCLSRLLCQATVVQNFRTFTVQ